MRVTSVTFGFTKNLGNFQSARADATVELADGDAPGKALVLARAIVYDELGMPLDEEEQTALLEAGS